MAAEVEFGVFIAEHPQAARIEIGQPDTRIEALRLEIAQQQRLRQMALTELLATRKERDMLAVALQDRSTIDAAQAVTAIMARADEDGAMHRDAMVAVLKSMGAR